MVQGFLQTRFTTTYSNLVRQLSSESQPFDLRKVPSSALTLLQQAALMSFVPGPPPGLRSLSFDEPSLLILLRRLLVLRLARAESALAAGLSRSRGTMGESDPPCVAHLPGLSECSLALNALGMDSLVDEDYEVIMITKPDMRMRGTKNCKHKISYLRFPALWLTLVMQWSHSYI
jgi:hypothetical protein